MIIIRIVLALACWITALMLLISLWLNGFDWRYLLAAITAWLLAYLLWPRQKHSYHKRHYSRENRINGWHLIDMLDIILFLIELPIRVILGLVHILVHLWH